MNCQDLQRHLDDYLDARLDAERVAQVERHLSICDVCSERLRVERLLRDRLRALPVPPPREGFAQRAFGAMQPRPGPQRPRYAAYAMAASLLAAVGVLAWLLPEGLLPVAGAPAAQVVLVHGDQVQPVQLVFNSPGALVGVTMHVGLPDGVELAQYPGVRELTWQADLKPGANVLALPVMVHGGGGIVTASVSYGAERRQFSVMVRTSGKSGAIESSGAAAGMIAHCRFAAPQEIIGHA
jgi:anti-sigma factor RsiW